MNNTLGDEPGHNDIAQQDLISDDVANAITSAINGDGDEMPGSATPATTVSPAPQHHEPQQNDNFQSTDEPNPPHEETSQSLPQPRREDPPIAPPPTNEQTEITNRGSGNVSELYDIKQDALKQLSPLVEHLEQGPEEKFETLIMMLRASDDPALIRPAYEAAQAIEDDKAKAQALLDVVNEVNYLTRPTDGQE